MIQLEGLAGITPSVFFLLLRYLLPFCALLLFRSDCSGSLLLTILFLVWYRVGKWGGLFLNFCRIGSEEGRFSGLFEIDGSREPAGRSAVFDGHEGHSGAVKTAKSSAIFLRVGMWFIHTPTQNFAPQGRGYF